MGPIDYSLDVQQPFQASLQGYQAGAAIRNDQFQQQQQQAALAQQQAQQAQQEALQRAYAETMANPTAENFSRLMLMDPKAAEAIQRSYSTRNEAQQKAFISDLGQYGAAFVNGQPQLVADMLNRRADAMEASGGSTQESQSTRALAKVATENPTLGFAKVLAFLNGGGESGKSVAEALLKMQTRPADLRKNTAEADKAESLATSAAVDAKYAEQKAKGEIAQQGATLGLTRAQVAQAQALTSKYGAETRETLMKLQQIGRPTQQQQFDAEAKLRGEYNKATEGYTDVTEAYRRLKASNNDAAGDLSLIFSYMKMLDPGSVVREGEFATAQNAAGVPDRLRNLFNRLLDGQRLTDGQRKQFTGQAESLYGAAQKREGEARAGLTRVARNYGLNAENIFGGRASEGGGKGATNSQRPPLSNFEGGG